jgi:ketosteroid isomerase-like protein
VAADNTDIVRRGLQAAIRRPEPDYATLNELYHPDHELVSRMSELEGGGHRGARGFHAFLLASEETLPWESTVGEVEEIDGCTCLVILPTRHRGPSSGIVLDEEPLAGLVTVRDGKIVRTEVFPSRERALDAARSRG